LKGFEAAVKQVTSWNPYNQNASSPFFDAEWMFGVKDGFNIVIGNPPYIDAKEQLKKGSLKIQREKLSKDKRYETLYQKWDLYIAFMEIGIKHFSSKLGLCTMIVPYPLTNQLYAKIMRKMLVDNYDLIELVDLNGTKVFENATVSNCIPLVRNSHTLKETIISKINKDKHIYHAFIQLHKDFIQDKNTLVWNLTQEKHDANKHVNLHVLGDFCYITKGMVLNADEKKAKGGFVKSDLISTISDDIHCKKYIEGKDIDRYSIKRIRFLEWNTKRCPDELSRPTFPELYTNKKLLINALGEMKASIDVNAEFYCEQQVRMALLWKDLSSVSNKSITSSIKKFSTLQRKEMEDLSTKVDLRYLLGIINSQYASALLSNIRGGDYHIVPEHIRNIPIPLATKEQQHRIAIIVDKILKTKQEDSQADTSKEEKEIDRLVYKLYGLTYDEVIRVDSEVHITEEVYNQQLD
jgi:adenine-specific DNA-methyltransferase